MPVPTLSPAGLRPMSAFVVIGTVVVAVAGRVTWVTHQRQVEQPDLMQVTEGEVPAYAIADRGGRVIAQFVPRFDLEMSPRAMWQVHTPRYMAERISEVLGGEPGPEELLQRFLPDARDGRIAVEAWDLSARQAHRLGRLLASHGGGVGGAAGGGVCGPEHPPIEGMWLERAADGRAWRLVWEPLVVLSREQREHHGCRSARTWGRHLALHLGRALHEPERPARPGEVLAGGPTQELCDEVWSALVPRAWCRPLEGLPSERVMDLRDLLNEEGVNHEQMNVSFGRDRVYPTGEHELLGDWGFRDAQDTRPVARRGLELACDALLADEVWDEVLERHGSLYRWRKDRTVRGQRVDGFGSYEPASSVPVVMSTLDRDLQAYLGEELARAVQEHRPALAMGIVVDVASGDVLAVDSVEEYAVQPFAPVYHTFTTGSTLKVLTMACALEEGLVRPEETLDVGHGEFRIVYRRGPKAGRKSGRVIREAEGALTGTITAADALAFSVNAGLTQIGLRLEDRVFRGYLERLGYGRKPGAGLGSERAGWLPELPWAYAYTHASICFGHEISSTVWQHAEALACVLRGGEWRPLRLLQAVEQGERRYELPPGGGERVFSPETCAALRAMMAHGADVGTGDDVRLELERIALASLAGIDSREGAEERGVDPGSLVHVGTKTGTAQKVPAEICVHVEMEARRRWRSEGLPVTPDRYRALRGSPKPHRECYTSSIVVYGRLAGDDRELMVYVVVEEPRGKERFGSAVAGPTAARVLAEALGLTVRGRLPERGFADGFFPAAVARRNPLDEPWRAEEPAW